MLHENKCVSIKISLLLTIFSSLHISIFYCHLWFDQKKNDDIVQFICSENKSSLMSSAHNQFTWHVTWLRDAKMKKAELEKPIKNPLPKLSLLTNGFFSGMRKRCHYVLSFFSEGEQPDSPSSDPTWVRFRALCARPFSLGGRVSSGVTPVSSSDSEETWRFSLT